MKTITLIFALFISLTAMADLKSRDLCKQPKKAAALKEKISTAFNKFDGTNPETLDLFYSDDVLYTDPILSVSGLKEVKLLLTHTYKNVEMLNYEFSEFICENNKISASYVLSIQIKGLNGGSPYKVNGNSVFHFNRDGLVKKHQDYFDLGSMVYEKHPLTSATILAIKAALGKYK
jgi:nuclear transport factor 2 (NTF2) superfamily protein